MTYGRVLTIAGSDSGGGAGIQADIKTITLLGAYASSAITAVTNQDTKAIHNVYAIPADFVAEQIKTVLSDIGADAIKVGMLNSLTVVEAVIKSLEQYGGNIPLIVDPVMLSKSGHQLLGHEALETFKLGIVQSCEVLTPNLPEAEILTGRKINSIGDMKDATPALRQLGAKNILLKGGHLEGNNIADLLITPNSIHLFEGTRIPSSSTHGTGCTLSSAIAVGIAQGLTLFDSIVRARTYVNRAIATATPLGAGFGPLNHSHKNL